MVRTICPSLSMRMKALGVNAELEAPWAALASPIEGPRVNPISMPPPSDAPALRNWRRVVMSAAFLVVRHYTRRVLDSFADSHVGTAATDVPRHGGVDIAIGRVRLGGEQRCRGHDLARLAITALRHFQRDQRLLDLFPGRRGANRFDRGDAFPNSGGD